ncbi:unnamed protein product, partial [Amoebophrya sp. A120]|eukprot:GSA120T00020376001.1
MKNKLEKASSCGNNAAGAGSAHQHDRSSRGTAHETMQLKNESLLAVMRKRIAPHITKQELLKTSRYYHLISCCRTTPRTRLGSRKRVKRRG